MRLILLNRVKWEATKEKEKNLIKNNNGGWE